MNSNLAFDFDSHAHARRSDPETSHVAAARAREFASSHAGIILACLKSHGPSTADEIAKRTPLDAVQVNRRLNDLRKEGLAYPTGATRLSASGRPERVWAAA